MLSVNLICIGSLKERYWREACDEYLKRLSSFCRINIIELPEDRLPERPSAAEIEKALEREGDRILSKASGTLLPLCIEGESLSSEGLSELIDTAALSGISTLSFVIGGSFGLSESVKRSGAHRISMSEMTFPHQLARVILLEQIYRAFMIRSNAKYHK